MKPAVRVAITGAAGQVAYALIFRIAAGDMLGAGQPVILQLLEIPTAVPALEGVKMELEDCAFPLLKGVVCTDDADEAFRGADFALLVGAKPRREGMERRDLLRENGEIFAPQGTAINRVASGDVKVLVIGNPANTNALIAMKNAPDLNPRQFSAMTRLDHNRSKAKLAERLGCWAGDIQRMTIWGNHSTSQFPDASECLVHGKPVGERISPQWIEETFIPFIRLRATQIIEARGLSSAASAASAAIDHMRDWVFGTDEGSWVSMGVFSKGEYGTDSGVCYSLPCRCRDGDFQVVADLQLSDDQRMKIKHSHRELVAEKEAVRHLLPS